MNMIYCIKNNSKTLPFTVNNPYKAEYISDGIWKIYGDDMTHILTPIDSSLVEFIIEE